jgi:predicted acetyltransferase
MFLVRPSAEHLRSYVAALERGYSPSSTRPGSRTEDLHNIEIDSEAFLRNLDGPEAMAVPVHLQDGSFAARISSFTRWMWDDEFAGSVGMRWLPGGAELPPSCMGHVGYSVVPWKRGLGYAKRALALILPEARKLNLPHLEVVTTAGNIASQRVALANGTQANRRS